MLIGQRSPTHRAIICIFDFIQFMLFIIDQANNKVFFKFEIHNYT